MRPEDLRDSLKGLLSGEYNWLANCANFCALLYQELPGLNWAGFYYPDEDGLVLGPFQGKPACVRIGAGRGVCGAAAKNLQTQRVADVHAFPGHIACDIASRSELVVPLLVGGEFRGVLDLDSPELNRFTAEDQAVIEHLCREFCEHHAV